MRNTFEWRYRIIIPNMEVNEVAKEGVKERPTIRVRSTVESEEEAGRTLDQGQPRVSLQ